MLYSLTVLIDSNITKFEAVFDSENEANRFADVMSDLILEFSFLEDTVEAFIPPF